MTLTTGRKNVVFKVSSFREQKKKKDKDIYRQTKTKMFTTIRLIIKKLLKAILGGKGKWSQKEGLRYKKEWWATKLANVK